MQRKSSAMSEQEPVVIIVITKHQYVRRRCRESLCYDPESILNKSRDNEVHVEYARHSKITVNSGSASCNLPITV